MFYIYILQSMSSGNYYVGYSGDPFKRLEQHNTKPTGTYTSKHLPWKLMALFQCPSKEVAIKLERYIKRQKSRSLIEKLYNPDFVLSGELAQLVRVPHLRINQRVVGSKPVPFLRDPTGGAALKPVRFGGWVFLFNGMYCFYK